MKKLYLVFVFVLMGVLFFACQKDEPVVEQSLVDSTEMLSVERTIDYLPCFQQGNCPCIIMSNMDPSFGHNAFTCITGLNLLPNGYYMQDANGVHNVIPYICQLPLGTCDWEGQLPISRAHMLPFHNQGGFNYGDFYHFCISPNNIVQVCNPHLYPIEMHLMCNPDAPNHQMATFTLAGGECKNFRISGHCHIHDCD